MSRMRVAALCPQCLWHVNVVSLCCLLQALRENGCCGTHQDFLRAAALSLLSLLSGIAQSGGAEENRHLCIQIFS